MVSLRPKGQESHVIGGHCALEIDVLLGQTGISESEVRDLIYPSVPLVRGYI